MHLMRRQDAWDPFREVEELGLRFDRLIGLNRWPGGREREELTLADWAPSCNITQRDNEYHVRAELPDVKKEDLRVTLWHRNASPRGSAGVEKGNRKKEKSQCASNSS